MTPDAGDAMRVCVTGGLGFVGSHLCRLLAGRGHEVVCIDRLSGTYAAGAGPRAAGALRRLPGVRVVNADAGGPLAAPLVRRSDAVVHLAALAGVRTPHGADALWRENVAVTERLLELSAGRRLVLVSSSSVYGNADGPASEDAPRSPLSPYARSKAAAEDLVFAAARERSADAVVARLFTVFGPAQRPDMAFAAWADRIAAGLPIRWCAAPGARRELTYVDDAVEGLAAVLERGRPGRAYNVAGVGSIAMETALAELELALGRCARVERRAPSSTEARVTAACGRRAARELGYRPATSLREGLERQVAAGRVAVAA